MTSQWSLLTNLADASAWVCFSICLDINITSTSICPCLHSDKLYCVIKICHNQIWVADRVVFIRNIPSSTLVSMEVLVATALAVSAVLLQLSTPQLVAIVYLKSCPSSNLYSNKGLQTSFPHHPCIIDMLLSQEEPLVTTHTFVFHFSSWHVSVLALAQLAESPFWEWNVPSAACWLCGHFISLLLQLTNI